jgi:endonuclease/exonuclease/phosphatase family metal-dependent hydrolase
MAASVRVATYNASLNRARAGQLAEELAAPGSEQASRVAAIVQRVRPDLVLLNEFDFDPDGVALGGFVANYLAVGQQGEAPVDYPYRYASEVNTGVLSGVDLDGDGAISLGNDAFGWGRFPGQYGMAILSRYPIDAEEVRTFTTFLWKDMPGALLPVDSTTEEFFYSEEALAVFRLSSKSHWDVPIHIGKRVLHLLASHPTPPVFDGSEDRNGRRNHDEIRFWADYLSPDRAGYIYDDAGVGGGLHPDDDFVIVGDLNADPFDGESVSHAVRMLLEHPRVAGDFTPFSDGAIAAANRQRRANDSHQGDPVFDTADFSDSGPGNLRTDYVLPSRSLTIEDGGVFWPVSSDSESEWAKASDHHLVWIDLDFEDSETETAEPKETGEG